MRIKVRADGLVAKSEPEVAGTNTMKTAMQPGTFAVDQTGETVIPLLAEEVAVSKQVIATGRVQVARLTHQREQLVDEMLARGRTRSEQQTQQKSQPPLRTSHRNKVVARST